MKTPKEKSSDGSPLPDRLRLLREARGVPQIQLGLAAGLDQTVASSRMNHYETGRHTPNYAFMRRVARILEVPTAYFYAEEDSVAALIISSTGAEDIDALLNTMNLHLPATS